MILNIMCVVYHQVSEHVKHKHWTNPPPWHVKFISRRPVTLQSAQHHVQLCVDAPCIHLFMNTVNCNVWFYLQRPVWTKACPSDATTLQIASLSLATCLMDAAVLPLLRENSSAPSLFTLSWFIWCINLWSVDFSSVIQQQNLELMLETVRKKEQVWIKTASDWF